jgi:hypothetical protein
MSKLTPLALRAWALPLIVLAIVVPGVGGFLLVGPALGMAVGALAATTVAVIAARMPFDEPIEVAKRSDERYHLLVVATTTIDPHAATVIAERVAASAGTVGAYTEDSVDLLVFSPVLNRGLTHWASDLGTAMVRAQERLVISLASLAAASVAGRGQVGDSDPLQATEDTLRSFPAQEVLLGGEAGQGGNVLTELRRRLDRPLRHIEVEPAEPVRKPAANQA